jgi:antirestriction protein ArdC
MEQVKSEPARQSLYAEPPGVRETIEEAEALITATGADFRIGGAMAFYAPALDYVQVPPQQAFPEPINWYRTALHELGHWTGHPGRLGRDLSGAFGSDAYAREELVAEMASAFVCASLSIRPTVRHADYVGSWLAVLREDERAIFRAASLASKAADYLLAFLPDREAQS